MLIVTSIGILYPPFGYYLNYIFNLSDVGIQMCPDGVYWLKNNDLFCTEKKKASKHYID